MEDPKERNFGRRETKLRSRRWALKLGACAMFIIGVGLLYYYVASHDSYSVESSLLFVQGHELTEKAGKRSLSQEIHILKAPNIGSLLAKEIYGVRPHLATGFEKPAPTKASAGTTPLAIAPPGYTLFGNADQFAKWVSKELSIESEALAPGVVKVTLQLQGDDPELLSSVVSSYVSQYADYRRSLEPQRKEKAEEEAVNPPPEEAVNPPPEEARESATPDSTSIQLQKLSADQQSYEAALQLIDSDKGVFSGFIPDDQILGGPLLSRIQDRILRLELNKRALSVSYYPGSSEITRVDQEIHSLRDDRRQFLRELQRFSEKRREILLAHTRGPGAQVARAQKMDTVDSAALRPRAIDTGALLTLDDGTTVFWQKPIVTKPFLLRVKQYLKRMVTRRWAPHTSG